MMLVCYEADGSTGWEELPDGTDMDEYAESHPDRTPTHVFRSGPEYQVDVIEQARFHARCRTFGFEPGHYRKLAVDENDDVMELYGFTDGKCLLRNISTGHMETMSRTRAHRFLNVKDRR